MHRVRIPRASPPRPVVAVRIPRPRVVRTPVRRTRLEHRRWKRRGRRAQVAAVATILGLLLVVTFIANYLATTLPNQMSINDLNHDLQVENQVGRLQALLSSVSEAGTPGAPVSQPITLGSAGLPPFAPADSGSIVQSLSREWVNYTVAGKIAFAPPVAGPPGGYVGSKCTVSPPSPPNSTSISCSGSTSITWNFSAGNGLNYYVNGTGGLTVRLNITTSDSSISITASGGAGSGVYLIGSDDFLNYTNEGGSSASPILVFGNYDNVSTSAKGGSATTVLIFGNHDVVSSSVKGSSTVLVSVYGSYDTVYPSSGGSNTDYFTGFNPQDPTSLTCPYGNESSTDTLVTSGGGSGTATWNNTGYTHTGTSGSFTEHWVTPAGFACPFTNQPTVVAAGTPAAGFAVQLQNTYAPVARVAYDLGGIVFAQSGGQPLFVDTPPIALTVASQTYKAHTYHNVTGLSVWAPSFQGALPSESGVSTGVLNARLISPGSITLYGSTGFTSATNITITVMTQYFDAWVSFFTSQGWPVSPTCTLVTTGASCLAPIPFATNGPLGIVSLTVPNTNLRAMSVAAPTFSVGLV
jgi:hypothetical protein